jgi:hypothetical protein
MAAFLPKLALLGAAFATGTLLRSTGVLSKQDAKVCFTAETRRRAKAPSIPMQNTVDMIFGNGCARIVISH